MKRFIYIVCTFLTVGQCALYAQDMQRLNEQSLTGTARYVGMAGAMTAIGGDPSAVLINPAGLGLYRRMEVMLTFDNRYDKTRQVGTDKYRHINTFGAPQVSWVLSFGNPYQDKGVIYNNIQFSYQRLHSFNRIFDAAAYGQPTSLADVIANKTAGLTESDMGGIGMWNNIDIGWLSCLGYETKLIAPIAGTTNQWKTPLLKEEKTNNALYVHESGYMDQYGFDWAMNISHKLYLGAGLRLQSFLWSRTTEYKEDFEKGGGLYNYANVIASGVGVNGAIGMLYRPIQSLRIGASFLTPSATTIRISNYGEMDATTDSLRSSTTLENNATNKWGSALRTSIGIAYQYKHFGLLSLQYDYAHHKHMQDVHTLRAGIEIVPINNLFINAGYAYESTFQKKASIVEIPYNSVRTDTDFQDRLSTQYISLGIGYRGRTMIAQVAYQLGLQSLDLYAHEMAAPYDMRTQTHRVVLTLGWHSR